MFEIKVFVDMIKNLKDRLSPFFLFFQNRISFIIFCLIFYSCSSGSKHEAEIEKIPVNISFDRFDLKFYNQHPKVIPILKNEYPFLFPKQFSDSLWIKRQKDSLQLLLQDEVNDVFSDTSQLEDKVSHLFKHIKFYFPKTKIPRVITLTNNVDYQIKIIYSDSLLLLSFDTFLGANNSLYDGIPGYIRKELDKKYILTQIVDKFGTYTIPPPEDRTFLAQLIYEGKKLYVQDLVQTHASDAIKISYLENELTWAKENELYVWKYFIEKQILYNTDPEWVQRFIDPSPFSKFYLQLDNQTPGGIGKWMGWQIIKSYIDLYPKTTIKELIKLPAQKLFNLSKYKPNR